MVKERAIEECKTMSEAYDEGYSQAMENVKNLITERLQMNCDKSSCDDCEEYCEISALMWVEKHLN